MSKHVTDIATYRRSGFTGVLSCNGKKKAMVRGMSFYLTGQLAQRIYFPSRVAALSGEVCFPMSERRHAEAVYENTMRFLETAFADDAPSRH